MPVMPFHNKSDPETQNRIETIIKSDRIIYYSLKSNELITMTEDDFNKNGEYVHHCDLCKDVYSYSCTQYLKCELKFKSFKSFKMHLMEMENRRFFRKLVWTEASQIPKNLRRERELGDLEPMENAENLKFIFRTKVLNLHKRDVVAYFKSNGCPCSTEFYKCNVRMSSLHAIFSHLGFIEKKNKKYLIFKDDPTELKLIEKELNESDDLERSKYSNFENSLKPNQEAHSSKEFINKQENPALIQQEIKQNEKIIKSEDEDDDDDDDDDFRPNGFYKSKLRKRKSGKRIRLSIKKIRFLDDDSQKDGSNLESNVSTQMVTENSFSPDQQIDEVISVKTSDSLDQVISTKTPDLLDDKDEYSDSLHLERFNDVEFKRNFSFIREENLSMTVPNRPKSMKEENPDSLDGFDCIILD